MLGQTSEPIRNEFFLTREVGADLEKPLKYWPLVTNALWLLTTGDIMTHYVQDIMTQSVPDIVATGGIMLQQVSRCEH